MNTEAPLAYTEFPAQTPATKPVLIILHGLFGSKSNWKSAAKVYAQQQTVLTVDLINHGQSPHRNKMSYHDMANDLHALFEHLAIKQCHLLGHSMGGKVAMTYDLHHPGIVKRLIIVDIAPKAYPLWHLQLLKQLLDIPIQHIKNRKQAHGYLEEFVQSKLERQFILKNLKRLPASSQPQAAYQWQINLQAITRNYLKIAGFHYQDKRSMTPCLFIRGEHSDYINPDDDIKMIDRVYHHAIIKTVSKSGHVPHIENPKVFNEYVSSFLA